MRVNHTKPYLRSLCSKPHTYSSDTKEFWLQVWRISVSVKKQKLSHLQCPGQSTFTAIIITSSRGPCQAFSHRGLGSYHSNRTYLYFWKELLIYLLSCAFKICTATLRLQHIHSRTATCVLWTICKQEYQGAVEDGEKLNEQVHITFILL
jgi:hypothetical protein